MVSILFFYQDGFGVKQAKKVDIPINKETVINSLVKTHILEFYPCQVNITEKHPRY